MTEEKPGLISFQASVHKVSKSSLGGWMVYFHVQPEEKDSMKELFSWDEERVAVVVKLIGED